MAIMPSVCVSDINVFRVLFLHCCSFRMGDLGSMILERVFFIRSFDRKSIVIPNASAVVVK